MSDPRIERYISIVPSVNQKAIQRDGFNIFIHYGMNAFANKEWSDGTEPASLFNPVHQNTDQWVELYKSIGAKGVVLTAKHHDGFCLWQTKTTEYSVKSSPYKDGKGDVVKELSDSCRKYGLKFGFYLSPWDRNSEYYGTDSYDDFYCAQLTELLTGYGDISCVWLDGACGAERDGKKRQVYDFDRYFALVHKYQPKAVIASVGPDVRWVGNEGGYARESEWNVIPSMNTRQQTIAASQTSEKQNMRGKRLDCHTSDLGSRKVLAGFDDFMWAPAEVDVSIRPGWFYHKKQDNKLRSVNNLTRIYLDSVGGNSLLLLNIPPNTDGLITDGDVERLHAFADNIKNAFSAPIKITEIKAPEADGNNVIQNILEYSYDPNTYDPYGYYTPLELADSYEIDLKLDGIHNVDKVRLVENVAFSQRVEKYDIYAFVKGKWKNVYDGTNIGFNRIAIFSKPVKTDRLKVVISECRDKPYMEHIAVYGATCKLPGQMIGDRIAKFFKRLIKR